MMRDTLESNMMRMSVAGIIFFAGWIGSAAYFDIHRRWADEHKLVHVETTVLPKLQTQLRQLNCDRSKLAKVAKQAIASQQYDSVPVPPMTAVSGCPKVKPVKPPSVPK